MQRHWWNERDPKHRAAMKAVATPRDDDNAQSRYRETKRQKHERVRPKGKTDRLLALADKIKKQLETRQKRENNGIDTR